jgi:hypothetical protein
MEGACAPSGEPHSPQNFTPGALGVPQAAHMAVSDAPHSPQNFRPSSFDAPQDAQIIDKR